ncbi:MAG: hypothetical protein KF814_02490 [Nitrospiraceae bacterium]|nr:hypothetical protein [Nitrospiraceae bacterium]
MVNALQTALSGMTAFSRSVGTTANNLANVATPEFKRGRTEFQEAQNGGVHTSNSVDSRPGPLIFQQTSQNPVFEEQSNVDMGEEMVNLIQAQREFELNVKVVGTTDAMLGSLLSIRK